MCILFIYRNKDADQGSYRLILVSNRDEYFVRPSKPAHFWQEYPHCLGGRDMEPGKEGGTWLAFSTRGRAGVTLNLRGQSKTPKSTAEGRGFLISDYLNSSDSTETHLKKLHQVNKETQKYNPYTLVLIDLLTTDVYWLDSSMESQGPQKCKEKIIGFSNSPVETPYKKVRIGKEKFEEIVKNTSTAEQDSLIEELLRFLKWRERHLPDQVLETRSPQFFPELSSIFVHSERAEYGTRTHSILLIDTSNKITFVEETLLPDRTWKTQKFETFLQ